MQVEVTAAHRDSVGADLVAATAGAGALELGAQERAVADADPVAIVCRHSAAPLAVIALTSDTDGLRTVAARAYVQAAPVTQSRGPSTHPCRSHSPSRCARSPRVP